MIIHDDNDQDGQHNPPWLIIDHFAEVVKRLLEIRSRARFRPMNGEVLHVGQRTTENIDLIDYFAGKIKIFLWYKENKKIFSWIPDDA